MEHKHAKAGFLGKGALQCPPLACLSGLGDRNLHLLTPSTAPKKATSPEKHKLALLKFII